MDEQRKRAYRWLLFRAMLDIRPLKWLGSQGCRPSSPLESQGEARRVQFAGVMADWLHNLAAYSAVHFQGFDERWFWDDFESVRSRYPELGLEHYQEEFARLLSADPAELNQESVASEKPSCTFRTGLNTSPHQGVRMFPDMFKVAGRVALVTGGSKGLGKAMARGLVEAGADVVISSRHEDELRAALDEILDGTGRRGAYVVADMANRADVRRLADTALEKMERIDILINNAGTNTPQAVDAIQDADWDRIMEINLHSIMVLTRALVPQMKARRWGRIIHISSIMALIASAGRSTYCSTKAALMGFARASALDLGKHGITVNCIAPGPFLTDLPGRILTQAEKDNMAAMTAVNRWGDPNELVGPALLLASEAGSYITGETLVVDGGFVAR